MFKVEFLKVIPAMVFLFCLLEIFEMVLIINDMNKTEKLEIEVRNNLKALNDIVLLVNINQTFKQHVENFQDKKINVK
ncbi:hypothetical protein DDP51_00795 [Helicobacter pylori]|uniref:hypothetical protein n=1 Tax=Helicobacter pylori TaxID=210 RepID=UPI000EAF6BA6|nr:hypothetical protein [Helicobacter pylori]RKV11112.1 hypothetical protein DDP51_00795 [Helicobacter pylori]